MKWNKIYYKDCRNEKNGIKYLLSLYNKGEIDKIDLSLTDPPWNKRYNGSVGSVGGKTKKPKSHFFNDNIDNYKEWCESWFFDLRKITKTLIMSVGIYNQNMWEKIEKPEEYIYHFKPNGQYGSRCGTFNLADVYFVYGEIHRWYHSNVFTKPVNCYFMQKQNLIHPCPKNFNLWYSLIAPIKPDTFIDPFVGSGTSIKICKLLNINYLGYEIQEKYKIDIEKKLNDINKSKSGILGWIEN